MTSYFDLKDSRIRLAFDTIERVQLIIVHNHFRPGGVRRVIELAAPWLVQSMQPRVSAVVLVAGEAFDHAWLAHFESKIASARVTCLVDRAFAYFAEQKEAPRAISRRIRRRLREVLVGEDIPQSLVWAHNQGLGRNLLLLRELRQTCSELGLLLVLHHHDWWFDNRWERWSEMRRCGFRTTSQVGKMLFDPAAFVRHVAINTADAAILRKHMGHTGWIPNPAASIPDVKSGSRDSARAWLEDKLGDSGPVWLMPCRLLRRKNIAEALLLTQWLRPTAWLVTTGGVSSREERHYAQRLAEYAHASGARLRLAILDTDNKPRPDVAELMAASEAVLLTSLQEGFGLPYIEAAIHGRPLICRALKNIMPDLKRVGLRFDQSYGETMIHHSLFDWQSEVARQSQLFSTWRRALPTPCRAWAQRSFLLRRKTQPQPVPFNRLTLTAQLEVLRQPTERSWALCAELNPELATWRELAKHGALRPTRWPASAQRSLGPAQYVKRFQRLLKIDETKPHSSARSAIDVQIEFFRDRLASENLYPLAWSSTT